MERQKDSKLIILTERGARELALRLRTLVIFRDLLKDPAIRELSAALYLTGDRSLRHLASFESYLFEETDNWSQYLFQRVLESENVCIRNCGCGRTLSPVLLKALGEELDFLQSLSQLSLESLPNVPDYMVGWKTLIVDIPLEYRQRMEKIETLGYGVFGQYYMFTLKNGQLSPIRHPDPQTLEQLPGYEREREKIIKNTEALLNDNFAGNVLLYGDAGTGKSSTVKAIANTYRDYGLRLVEIKKEQLHELPDLMATLADNPLKFIIFIDDLSFSSNDSNFAALKAILEGGAESRAPNTAVYATSNRRHLIKETLSDREGDDIHAADTRQELMSLAARFGLVVTFQNPDRKRYLYIIQKLAEEYNLDMDKEEREKKAEAFAIRSGGRSARVAKQFIELCKSGVLDIDDGI